MIALKPAENGAAERNRTSDPVITNEGKAAQSRYFPSVLESKVAYYPLKVRKSAQKYIRKMRLIRECFFKVRGILVNMRIDLSHMSNHPNNGITYCYYCLISILRYNIPSPS
jgi:hypothetical protein